MKDSFRDDMLTDLGRQLCDERQTRNRRLFAQLQEELAEEALNRKYGMLGAVQHLFTNAEDPSLHEHAESLRAQWLPERERLLAEEQTLDPDRAGAALERSRAFSRLMDAEISGTA